MVTFQAYGQALKQALLDGIMGKEEAAILGVLRKTFGISDQEHSGLEQEVQLEIYLEAIMTGWKDGAITPQDSEKLDELRDKFKISAEEHLRLEKQVRHEILRQK